ncbi:hypothetical protein SZN_15948 [Streptomyces zinciresistens K42]|uniref:Uncharacterized protein n=1 Tax=Streptomyces zinciresistens K42 TaxID=700597 RepID=G2GCG5_9ACTN|nr:hypothetical protein [Streptomyces zinciresistens]EGX58768.1 hypothetical protein SZN_15948 [Streptomyces zinciresistens K42]
MHAYDVPRLQGGSSPTPIYDALYAEYVKSFRTLPGDRSGEEDMGFVAFGSLQRVTGSYGGHRQGSFSSSYSAYSAGAHSARHNGAPQPQWQRVANLGPQGAGMQHVPAALPPARRG